MPGWALKSIGGLAAAPDTGGHAGLLVPVARFENVQSKSHRGFFAAVAARWVLARMLNNSMHRYSVFSDMEVGPLPEAITCENGLKKAELPYYFGGRGSIGALRMSSE